MTLVTWILLGMLMTCHTAWHPGKGINYSTWPLKVKSRADEQSTLIEMTQTNDTAQETLDGTQIASVQPEINDKIEQRMDSNYANPEAFLRQSVTLMLRKNQEPIGIRCYLISGPQCVTLPQRRLFKRDVTTDAEHTPNIVNAGSRASDFRDRLISLGLLKPVTQPLTAAAGLEAAKTAAALEAGKAAAGVDVAKNVVGLGLLKKAAAAPVVLAGKAAGIGLTKLAAPKLLALGGAKKVAEVAAVKTVASKAAAIPVAKAAGIGLLAAPKLLALGGAKKVTEAAAVKTIASKAAAVPVAKAAGIGLLAGPKLLALGGAKKVAEAAAVTAVASKGTALAPLNAAKILGGAKAVPATNNVAEVGTEKLFPFLPLKGLGSTNAVAKTVEVDKATTKPVIGFDLRQKISELGLFPNLFKPVGLGKAATTLTDKTESVTTNGKDQMLAAASHIVPVKVVAPRLEPSRDSEAAATIAFENTESAGLENSTPLNMQDDMEENTMQPRVGNTQEQTTTQIVTMQTEKTPEILAFEMCMNNKCVLSPQYDPVCGTDGVMYNNLGHLLCAQLCGKDVHFSATKLPSCYGAESTTTDTST